MIVSIEIGEAVSFVLGQEWKKKVKWKKKKKTKNKTKKNKQKKKKHVL